MNNVTNAQKTLNPYYQEDLRPLKRQNTQQTNENQVYTSADHGMEVIGNANAITVAYQVNDLIQEEPLFNFYPNYLIQAPQNDFSYLEEDFSEQLFQFIEQIPVKEKVYLDFLPLIPEELVFNILDLLEKDSELKKIALVSKNWRKLAMAVFVDRLNHDPYAFNKFTIEQLGSMLQVQGKRLNSLDLRYMDSNDDQIVQLMKYCPNLSEIKVSSVKITHIFLKNISHLTNLSVLDLFWNSKIKIEGLDSIAEHTGIQSLKICTTFKKINDISLCRISNMTNLTKLSLRCDEISDLVFKNFSKLTALKMLELENITRKSSEKKIKIRKEISGTGFAYLSSLRSLETLDLDLETVTDEGFSCFPALTNLKNLHLKRPNFITSVGLACLSRFTFLKKFELVGSSNINDKTFSSISLLTSLEELKLGCTSISNKSIPYLSNLMALREIKFEYMKITGEGFNELGHLTNLIKITDYYGRLQLKNIEHLHSLQYLEIAQVEFKDYDFSSLASFKSLRELDLNGNYIREKFHLVEKFLPPNWTKRRGTSHRQKIYFY